MSSHRRLIAVLFSPLTLSIVRRFALIAVGAAVAYSLLLPAAAAWLRRPAATPLPGPVNLESAGGSGRPGTYAVDDRVHSKLLSRSRSVVRANRARQRRRPAAHRARPVVLAPTPSQPVASRRAATDDHNGLDDPVDALDEHGDDELGDD